MHPSPGAVAHSTRSSHDAGSRAGSTAVVECTGPTPTRRAWRTRRDAPVADGFDRSCDRAAAHVLTA